MNACGCGEDQIPWMLTKFGLLGTAGLVLTTLVLMILAGWVLATGVWLIRRRGESGAGEAGRTTGAAGRTTGAAGTDESPDALPTAAEAGTGAEAPHGSLDSFTWHTEDR